MRYPKYIPKDILPDIKKITTMAKIREVLDKDHSKAMDVCNKGVHPLVSFEYSSNPERESTKF